MLGLGCCEGVSLVAASKDYSLGVMLGLLLLSQAPGMWLQLPSSRALAQ